MRDGRSLTTQDFQALSKHLLHGSYNLNSAADRNLEFSLTYSHVRTSGAGTVSKVRGTICPARSAGKFFKKCPLTFSLCPPSRVGTDEHVPSWFTVSVYHRCSLFMVIRSCYGGAEIASIRKHKYGKPKYKTGHFTIWNTQVRMLSLIHI